MRAINCFPQRVQYCAAGGNGFHIFHRTWLSSRLKISIEQYARIASRVSIHSCPQNKAGTEKNIRLVKEGEVRTKKELLHARDE
ncbi:MAG TPA: hypothetical protein VHL05_07105 [Terriglobales bacterium]|nr:hypothetical protein [Terriglobales bacterium]